MADGQCHHLRPDAGLVDADGRHASTRRHFAWTTPTTAPGAGTPSQSVTFTPTDTTDYSTVTGTVSVTVNKATPR